MVKATVFGLGVRVSWDFFLIYVISPKFRIKYTCKTKYSMENLIWISHTFLVFKKKKNSLWKECHTDNHMLYKIVFSELKGKSFNNVLRKYFCSYIKTVKYCFITFHFWLFSEPLPPSHPQKGFDLKLFCVSSDRSIERLKQEIWQLQIVGKKIFTGTVSLKYLITWVYILS